MLLRTELRRSVFSIIVVVFQVKVEDIFENSYHFFWRFGNFDCYFSIFEIQMCRFGLFWHPFIHFFTIFFTIKSIITNKICIFATALWLLPVS